MGLTLGLVLTIYLGVGAQIYRPPIKDKIPPPMDTLNCPYVNATSSMAPGNMTSLLTIGMTSSMWPTASSTLSTEDSSKYVR